MAVEQIDLELIDDNPFNPRKHYPREKVKEMAYSLKQVGLRQIPEARPTNGRYQLAYGHMRKLAWLKNFKEEPEAWRKMPLDVKEISDQDMFHYAMEENLRRTDIRPIEVARCFENYFVMFPDATEVELAKKHNMTQGNVSNMLRVLRLPEKVLEKVDEGRITFTQARELVILEKLENSEELMLTAIRGIRTEGRPYGHANTVEGMQVSVHDVVGNHCRPLDKQWEGYRWDLIFDTRAAGCLQCDKMLRTHPTKSAAAHYCIDDKCWDRHQEEQREKVSVDAKAKMEADILRRAAQEPRAASQVSISQEIPASCQDCPTLNECIGSQVWQAYKGNPACPNRGIKPAITIPERLRAPVTAVPKDHFEQEISQRIAEAPAPAPQEIPEDILALAREKAGTRAEVLDLKDIGAGYYQEVKQGYALLDDSDRALEHILDPDECKERCTHGFHFAFDSRQPESRTRYVCSDTKCLTKKKAAFTRAKNAEGQTRKNAERKAIKEAIAQTTILDRPRIKLILLAQMEGLHASRTYYYGTEGGIKKPEIWLWEKISAGTPAIEREREDLFKRIDKLTDEELAKLVVEMMFYYLTDKGDIGSYEIKAAEPLKWVGIEVQLEKPTGDKDHG